MKLLISFTWILGIIFHSVSYGTVVNKTLVLNKGIIYTVDSNQAPYYCFNSDTIFRQTNERILATTGDSLVISVLNNTLDTQSFVIKDYLINELIYPNSTKQVSLVPSKAGIHVYSSGENGKEINHWGASGMLLVTDANDANKATYYWNIKEFELEKVKQLDSGKTVDWNTYYPDYFTVNGLGKDQLVGDVVTNPTGLVGDSILIAITNTGKALHPIHFHGYHCIAKEVNSKTIQKGSNKDTFSIKSGDAVLLLLIPDKIGVYPVHDHNLIAVAGGGKYPNGIFMIINIK
ncbi:MAG: multicopper oxidase domain-containing protein [Flavobacteriales bacterium]|nr:multicopper oxidase domain-containing protein [Flavobacteriales bacterium]